MKLNVVAAQEEFPARRGQRSLRCPEKQARPDHRDQRRPECPTQHEGWRLQPDAQAGSLTAAEELNEFAAKKISQLTATMHSNRMETTDMLETSLTSMLIFVTVEVMKVRLKATGK